MADPPPGARLVVPAAEVEAAWQRLAALIQPHVTRESCVLIGVLIGGMVPLVRIASLLRGDFVMDYCHVTRYRGATTGGESHWVQPPHQPLAGRTVILVDDIFDEGHTLAELRRHCLAEGAAKVLAAVLVRKRHERPLADSLPEYVGLEIGDEYVFGCGMDYHERWRHLGAIYALGRDPRPPGRPGRSR
jgi:hypoxanthine phosphoribosyltransferase